jgi:hypothetical protein
MNVLQLLFCALPAPGWPAQAQEPAAQAQAPARSTWEIDVGDPPRAQVGGEEHGGMLWLSGAIVGPGRMGLMCCENVLEGNVDFGLYPLRLKREDWRMEGAQLAFQAAAGPGLLLEFRARVAGSALELEYTLHNQSERDLERARIGPCLRTLGAPDYHPGSADQAEEGTAGRRARLEVQRFPELHERLFLWRGGEAFRFADSELAAEERHLAFLGVGAESIQWSWWVNDPKLRFDEPLIALRSKDGRRIIAWAFERADWASANTGDGRACFHLFPALGRVPKGGSASARGRLYALEGALSGLRERARKDLGWDALHE